MNLMLQLIPLPSANPNTLCFFCNKIDPPLYSVVDAVGLLHAWADRHYAHDTGELLTPRAFIVCSETCFNMILLSGNYWPIEVEKKSKAFKNNSKCYCGSIHRGRINEYGYSE